MPPEPQDRCLACRAPMGNAVACPACGWSFLEDADEPPEPDVARTATEDVRPESMPPHLAPPPPTAGGWGEVGAVLAVGVIPNLIGALTSLHTPAPPLPYWLDACHLIVLTGCPIYVVLYLIHRGGEPWARFGVDRPCVSDVPVGVALLFVWFMLYFVRVAVLPLPAGPGGTYPGPGRADYGWMVAKFLVSAYSEELIVRAYLITRLTGLLGSPAKAVVLAAAAFASYHAYQGVGGVVDVFIAGLAFGFAYLVLGRLWPLVIAHALFNVTLELMLP